MFILDRLVKYIYGPSRWEVICPVCRGKIVVETHRRPYLTRCPACECVLDVAPNGTTAGHVPVEWLRKAERTRQVTEKGD